MAEEVNEPTPKGEVETPEVEKVEGLTEDAIKAMIDKTNREWQSRFDKVLAEKKESESKSLTADERIAEIERKYEAERVGRTRERVLNDTKLDATLVDAMQSFLGTSEEGIKSGAAQIRDYIQKQIDSGVQSGVEKEIARRFPGDKAKPQGGDPGGETTYEQLLGMTDEQQQSLGTDKVNGIINAAMGK